MDTPGTYTYGSKCAHYIYQSVIENYFNTNISNDDQKRCIQYYNRFLMNVTKWGFNHTNLGIVAFLPYLRHQITIKLQQMRTHKQTQRIDVQTELVGIKEKKMVESKMDQACDPDPNLKNILQLLIDNIFSLPSSFFHPSLLWYDNQKSSWNLWFNTILFSDQINLNYLTDTHDTLKVCQYIIQSVSADTRVITFSQSMVLFHLFTFLNRLDDTRLNFDKSKSKD